MSSKCNFYTNTTDEAPLKNVITSGIFNRQIMPNIDDMVIGFANRGRTLLSDTQLSNRDLSIDTCHCAPATRNDCLDVLRNAEQHQHKFRETARTRERQKLKKLTYTESASEKHQLVELSQARSVRASRLQDYCKISLLMQREYIEQNGTGTMYPFMSVPCMEMNSEDE